MSMRSWIRKLFIRPFGRAAPEGRRGFHPTVDLMEDRIAPANVFDHGTATLDIVLGTDENLAITSSGASYGLTTNLKFTNGGVSNTTSDFSPFGGANLKLNPSGISRYTTAIEITDSGAGDSVTFSDSGGNTYANNFTVLLTNAKAGAITFQGASTFAGNDALSASTTMNLVVSAGATVSTSGGDISLASTGSNTPLIVNGGVTSAAGDVILQATGDITLNAPVTASGGAVTLNADSDGDGVGTLSNSPGSGGVSIVAAGPVTATAAAVNFQGPIASGGIVSIAPSQVGATIDLGGATNSLQITNADLAEISAGLLQIGASSAGNIQVSSGIDAPAGWRSLDLVTAANVTQTTSGIGLSVTNLNITAPTGIGFNGQPLTLDVTTLTTNSSGANGDQFLDDAGTAQLASADALNAGSGTVELDGGAFQLTVDDAVASVSNLSVRAGATFDLNGQVDTVNTEQLAGGTISDTLGGGVLTSTATIDAQDGTASAILAGNNGLTKSTDGTVTLSGANIYTGTTTISGGTLSISSDANLGTPPTTATTGSIVLNGGTLQATGTFTLNSNRGIALGFATGGGAAGTIDVPAGNTLTYGGILADNGGGVGTLAKTGSGILVLAGSNTYTGATLINGGTLQIGAGGATGSLGAGTVADNASLVFNLSSDATIPNIISGLGSLTQSGSGTTTLTNANSYSGATTVTAGTLADGVNNALPTGTPLTLASPGAFDLAGFNQTIAALTGSPGSTLQADINSASAYDQLTVSGPTNLNGATLSLVGMIASLVGQVLTLINSALAINGIFNTLPEVSATVTVNGVRISTSPIPATT